MSESLVDIWKFPPPQQASRSCSVATGNNYNVVVSNKAGYLCHLHVVCHWVGVKPEVPFAVLTHPDNSSLIRDMRRVGLRKVLKAEPGYKELEVHTSTKVKELSTKRSYSSWLHVTEDSRDPNRLKTGFKLIKSEIYVKFSGEWFLEAVCDPSTGQVVGCRGVLQQDILPKGVPSFIARLPFVGQVVRRMAIRAITRLLEDLNAAVQKVTDGIACGCSREVVMLELCRSGQHGPAAPASTAAIATSSREQLGHPRGSVKSFAVEVTEEGEEGREVGGEPAAWHESHAGVATGPQGGGERESAELAADVDLGSAVRCVIATEDLAPEGKSGVQCTVAS